MSNTYDILTMSDEEVDILIDMDEIVLSDLPSQPEKDTPLDNILVEPIKGV